MPSGDLMLCRGLQPTGSTQPSTATVEGQQRVLRRLLTTPGTYIFHLLYGAGLPQYVGLPAAPPAIQTVIMTQMFAEDSVSQDPLPTVSVTPINDGINTNVAYKDKNVGRIVSLGFDINA